MRLKSRIGRRGAIGVCAVVLGMLSGCSLNSAIVDNSDTNDTLPVAPVKDKTLYVTPSLSVAYEKMVYWGAFAGVAYLVLDPFSPNWEIQEARMPENHVHFQLSMKRYYSGGAGEARCGAEVGAVVKNFGSVVTDCC